MARVIPFWIEIRIFGTLFPMQTFSLLLEYFSQFKRATTSYETLP